MDNEQIESLIKQLKASGLGEEEIMEVLYKTFEEGEMDRKDLETLAEAMGYELTDDFKNDAQPDPISGDSNGELGDMSKAQLEDAKEIDEGESPEEFKDKLGIDGDAEPETSEDTESEEDNSEDTESDENEDEEWDKAQKMFKV